MRELPLFSGKPAREPRDKVRRGGWAWGPVEGAKLRVLSLGAGVQSTTLALMAAHGEIGPMPDVALFADTGDETRGTMDNLAWLMSGNVLPFPIKKIGRVHRQRELPIRLRCDEYMEAGGAQRVLSQIETLN